MSLKAVRIDKAGKHTTRFHPIICILPRLDWRILGSPALNRRCLLGGARGFDQGGMEAFPPDPDWPEFPLPMEDWALLDEISENICCVHILHEHVDLDAFRYWSGSCPTTCTLCSPVLWPLELHANRDSSGRHPH